jgi:hypothetical protein
MIKNQDSNIFNYKESMAELGKIIGSTFHCNGIYHDKYSNMAIRWRSTINNIFSN